MSSCDAFRRDGRAELADSFETIRGICVEDNGTIIKILDENSKLRIIEKVTFVGTSIPKDEQFYIIARYNGRSKLVDFLETNRVG